MVPSDVVTVVVGRVMGMNAMEILGLNWSFSRM